MRRERASLVGVATFTGHATAVSHNNRHILYCLYGSYHNAIMMAATALPVEAAAEYAALKARRDATPSGPQRMLVGAQILDHLAPYTDFDGIQSTYLDEDDLFSECVQLQVHDCRFLC